MFGGGEISRKGAKAQRVVVEAWLEHRGSMGACSGQLAQGRIPWMNARRKPTPGICSP
jgi:hypothetical protein